LILNFFFLFLSQFTQLNDSLALIGSFGEFHHAVSISSSREEYIFVSDIQTSQVSKFSKNGDFLLSSGGTGFGPNQLNQPYCIDASNGLDVFVCDYNNNRILRYDLNLNFITSFDFNNYNQTADNSRKIYYPYSIAFLNTSDIFVLADAMAYRVVKLNSLDEVSILFGSSSFGFDKLTDPKKVIRGSNLDIFILDAGADEIIHFDNYGTIIKRMKNLENDKIISIAYYKDNLYILKTNSMDIYGLITNKYLQKCAYFNEDKKNIDDMSVLNDKEVLILSNTKAYKYLINKP
jgi:hypothetical protein